MDKITAASRRIFRTSGFPLESDESNIGLEESGRTLDTSPYSDDPAQEPSQCFSQYHDDPTREGLLPQQYISHVTGESRLLKVQSTSLDGRLQPVGNWIRVNVSGDAPYMFRLSAWVGDEGHHNTHPSYRTLAWLAAVVKALLLTPIYAFTIWKYVGIGARRQIGWQIPREYPKFRGQCSEYPKHARSNLDISPASLHPHPSSVDNRLVPTYPANEQRRLHRPRRLFVKNHDSWIEMDGDGLQTEKPYIFISYAAKQFQRSKDPKDPSGRDVLTEAASQRIKERAAAVTEQNGLSAYWIDFLTAPNQPEKTDDVHRFCDVVRGSELVCVLLAEDGDMANSLAMFGKRLWCLPECLLAPRHEIYVQGGGKSEMISIMQLPARAWTNSYIDVSGDFVEGNGKEEEFHLLAEHYSGSLKLSRIQEFSVALSAMRALEFSAFQRGDIAYALMGLLCKRPAMDPTDSEHQALVRVCLYNDSDRILERIVCLQPSKDDGWLTTKDSFGVNLWDIEPVCQVAGLCHDGAMIIDGCHGITIDWDSVPRIPFATQKTTAKKIVLSFLWSTLVWMQLSFSFGILFLWFSWISIIVAHDDDVLRLYIHVLDLIFKITACLYLSLSFLAPFCVRWVYEGKLQEIAPRLIGVEGTMPIDELERIAFGTVAGHGRLQYSTSSGSLCSQSGQTRTGVPQGIDRKSLPASHRVFTLLDTGSMTVTVFSAQQPPTVALLSGTENGKARAVLCSYHESTNALHTETVLRMETSMLHCSSRLGRVKLATS